MEEVKKEKKKQPYISYLKGFAIVAVIFIHLIDWGALSGIKFFSLFKEALFPGVMFFVSMIGALMYFAYKDSDLKRSIFKLIKRGVEIIGVYYIYSIVKLFVFDFSKEPYYGYFNGSDRMHDLINILSLKAGDVPLTILVTLGFFMIISPLFLFIIKKAKYPKLTVLVILAFVVYLNYFVQLPHNVVTNLLYSNGYVFHPVMLWMTPYLVGILVAMIGLDLKKKLMLLFSFGVMAISFIVIFISSKVSINDFSSVLPSFHMYPLDLYYVVFSLFFMYLLIYFFGFVEKIKNKFSTKFLEITTFLGENTLSLFIFHWIIIDLTYWIFAPREWMILITVPVSLFIFVLIKIKTKSRIVLDSNKTK